jgi:hypothetical protein
MRRSVTRLVAIALCSSLAVSCAIPLGGPRLQTRPTVSPPPATTRPASEVLLTPTGGPPTVGKLVGIDGDRVTFLPAPYWNVAPREIGLGEIATIEVRDRKRSLGAATGVSFVTGFVLIGAICGASADYDQDYQDCLLGSAVLGAAAGLVGLGVGAVVDASRPRTYRFDGKGLDERRKTVQRLVLQ